MSAIASDGAAGPVEQPLVFDAFLHPNRSLSRRGFRLVMAAAIGASLAMGAIFLVRGAWPVFGFYGIEVLVIYLALRQSYRTGLVYEKVRLTAEQLTVEKGDAHGPQGAWTFQPHWLRVSIDDPVRHESQLTLSSHGRSVVLAAFLSPEERLDFARALKSALGRVTARPALAP